MSQFEFMMMIASVVVAISMTELASGWGKLVRSTSSKRYYFLHLAWTVYLLLLAVQYWIGMWSYNDLKIQFVGQVYFLVIPTVFLVISAYALTPHVSDINTFDAKAYFFKNRKGIFLSMAVFFVLAWTADLVIAGVDRIEINFLAMSVALALAKSCLAFTNNRILHGMVLAFAMSTALGGMSVELAEHDGRWQSP